MTDAQRSAEASLERSGRPLAELHDAICVREDRELGDQNLGRLA